MRPSALARLVICLLVGLAAGVGGAAGEVVDASDSGFTVRSVVTVPVPPDKAYAALTESVGRWWDPAHTFSGDSANLSIDPKPQGCFCERLPGGGVRHLTVVFALPGKILRLAGALGPLQDLGVAGSMTWKFQPAEGGTTVEVRYTVGGYRAGGLKDLAIPVDGVLHAQADRYKRFLETGKP